jgi:hypothetical protein
MAGKSKEQSRFELVIGAVDKFSGTFGAFNKRMNSINKDVGKLQASFRGLAAASGLTRLTNSVQGVGKNLSAVASEGKNLLSTLTGLAGKAGLLFGGATGGVLALAKGVADAGDAAVKSAQRAGVGIKTWQEYAHAAALADLDQEKLIKGFGGLQDAAVKAAQGDKAKSGVFKLLGINPKTAKGEIKNADTLFLELADKVKALQDAGQGAKAVNLLGDVLGDRDARSFVPMLAAGREGLLAAREEAHRLGIVLSAEDGSAAEEFNDNFSRLGAAFKGIGFSIGKDLMPQVTKFVGKLTEWISAQRGIVTGGLKEWLDKLDVDEVFESFVKAVDKLKVFGATVNRVAQFFGGWENVMLGLAGVISGKFLLSIANLGIAFGKLGLAMLTTPVGWFLAGLAGIAAAAYVIYQEWDNFVAYFEDLWSGVKSAFERSWLEGVVTVLRDFNPVALIFDGMNKLIQYFTGIDIKSIILGKLQDLASSLPEWAQELLFGKSQTPALAAAGAGDGTARESAPARDAASSAHNIAALDDFGSATGFGPARDLAPAAREIAETRTEHVEREEVKITVASKDGTPVSVSRSGNGDSNVNFSQTGQTGMYTW